MRLYVTHAPKLTMPIPTFDLNGVLPPHLGNPTNRDHLSPYRCTTVELCDRFAATPERVAILDGLLRLRNDLVKHGMNTGFQWVDGSFLTDIEALESRAPRDIDVVTLYQTSDPHFAGNFVSAFPEINDHGLIKSTYHVDHYVVDIGFDPEVTVDQSRYWYGLFTHGRNKVWKGILRLELDTAGEDLAAASILRQRSVPSGVLP